MLHGGALGLDGIGGVGCDGGSTMGYCGDCVFRWHEQLMLLGSRTPLDVWHTEWMLPLHRFFVEVTGGEGAALAEQRAQPKSCADRWPTKPMRRQRCSART